MVVRELLEEAARKLSDLEYTDSSNEAIRIFTKMLEKDESYIFLNLDKKLDEKTVADYRKLVNLRSKGYPFHYIFKKKGFLDLDLYVEEGVLIPRPETEQLTEYIIDYIKRVFGKEKLKLLEIGVGSGAISISIAKHCENVEILGLDIDEKAIEVSNINKKNYKLDNVSFEKSDLFKYLENKGYRYNIIVSNPPYIRTEDIENLQIDVRNYEPRKALDGGTDGLDFYRAISKKALDYLEEEGLLIYELGWDQAGELVEILENNGFRDIEIIKDLQGHDRIVLGFKK